MVSLSSPRQRCPHCHRALRTCICPLAQRIEHQVEVLILMHPMEVHEAKGTGYLLHQCLPRSRIMVGEVFQPAELEQALHGNWADSEPPHSFLLYPDTAEQDRALGLAQPPRTADLLPRPGQCLRLVVIDGTWRKSRKMLYLNPALQTLPRITLQHTGSSSYSIRKAHLPGQLSSFEATAMALAQLQNWPANASPSATLNQVFEHFVAQQIQLRQHHQTLESVPDPSP